MDAQQRHYEDKLAYEIDSWDLQVALTAGDEIVVLDARSVESFAAEHIPGAINIPHRTMTEDTTRDIDRRKVVVTYCDGIGCNASTKAALKMLKLEFQVKELLGGIDWWKRDGHPTTKNCDVNADCGCG